MQQLYFSHRARSCHSFSWKMSACRSLKFWQPTWPCKWVEGLSEGGNSFHSQKLACILLDLDVQRDTQHQSMNWNWCCLSQAEKKNPFLFLAILFPKVVIWSLKAPQGTCIQQGNRRTVNWKMALMLLPDCMCFFKTVSAPSHVGTAQACLQLKTIKSLLMIVFKNAAIFCLHFVSLPLYFQFFWVTHCQRMLFWLSCMFSLSSVDKSLPQLSIALSFFSGRLFSTLQGHPVLFEPLSWRSIWSPLFQ